MTNIAFNMHIGSMLRAKYSISLAVLPIGLMFASFIPSWLVANWFALLLDIPMDGPVKDMENGMLWLILFLAFMVFSMIAGYLIGWAVNALICFVLFGWERAKVSKVYLRSQVPQHWLNEGHSLEIVVSNKMEEWKETRKKGAKPYVLRTGVFGWGLVMYFVMAILPALRSNETLNLYSLAWQAVIWALAGALFGYLGWMFSEKQYRKHADKKT